MCESYRRGIRNTIHKYFQESWLYLCAEGSTEGDCKNRVRESWNKWRETSSVICDKQVPVTLKGIGPIYIHATKWWAVRKTDEQLLNETEMLRWIP